MEQTYQTIVNVTQGEQRDDLYVGCCVYCGRVIYEGDTIYKGNTGKYCIDCFFAHMVDGLLTIA